MAMNQSTENLVTAGVYDQFNGNGYINDGATIYQPMNRAYTVMTTAAEVHQAEPPPAFVLGPYNHRKRLLSCIVENWPESDSFNSLPVECNQSPRDRDVVDCAGVPMKKPFSWEAEDVAEYITTLDEACILDIESYEEIDKLEDQQKWIAQTYGPIYEPLLRPNAEPAARPKSLCINYDTHPKLSDISNHQHYAMPISKNDGKGNDTATSCENLIQTTDLDENNTEVDFSRSTDNLIATNATREEDFLYLNPAYNRSKCRTPLPVLSLNSSFYDESTSMNSSMYDPNSMNVSQISGGGGGGGGGDKNSITSAVSYKLNAINPLENSVIDMDGDKVIGDEQMSTMKVAAENGKFFATHFYYLLSLITMKIVIYHAVKTKRNKKTEKHQIAIKK